MASKDISLTDEAFDYYYSLGKGRNLKAVAIQFNVTDRTVQRWAKAFKWKDKARQAERTNCKNDTKNDISDLTIAAAPQANKVGRPKIEIDLEVVEKLAQRHCTYQEIADWFNVSVSKLDHDPEFIQTYKKGLSVGKRSLRKWQFEAASKGNITMLIWLGKQYLAQRDTPSDMDDDGTVVDLIRALRESRK